MGAGGRGRRPTAAVSLAPETPEPARAAALEAAAALMPIVEVSECEAAMIAVEDVAAAVERRQGRPGGG